jgi:hypothetical protein
MRNPLSKALWSIGLVAVGIALVLLGDALNGRINETMVGALVIAGIGIAAIFLFIFLWALLSAIGYARLMSGKNVIARWHVSPNDWDRFRVLDKVRASEHLYLRNDMRIRKSTPPKGVDVIVGRGKIVVDGSYHSIAGRSYDGRYVNWLNAPADPECLEFPKSYPRSKGGSVELTLRVPVPAAARAEGVKVFDFYRAKDKK